MDVTLDSAGGDEMMRDSRANVGKPMAVVFIEQRSETVEVDGKPVMRIIKDEKVVSVATIQSRVRQPLPRPPVSCRAKPAT